MCGLCFGDWAVAAPEALSVQFYVSLFTERLSKCHKGVKTEEFSFRQS